MNNVMLGLVFALALFAPVAHASDPGNTDNATLWHFDVMAGERNIGSHRISVMSTDLGTDVASTADFNVKLLFVNVFNYQHRSHERWQNDCLANISASTILNRDQFDVQGSTVDGTFMLTRHDHAATLPSCVQTFAYWDPDVLLNADTLLNPQTGKLEDVQVSYSGVEAYPLNGRPIAADRYRVSMASGYVDLWYDRDTRIWLGLEALDGDGNLITYVPRTTPLTSA